MAGENFHIHNLCNNINNVKIVNLFLINLCLKK